MRKVLLIGLSLVASSAIAQTTLVLEENNCEVKIADNGVFFNDPATSFPGYEVPKGSGNHILFSMALWMSGVESSTSIPYAACNNYDGMFDLYPGPVCDDYLSSYFMDNFASSIWSVSADQIELHKMNYSTTGYVPDDEIADWPGNGGSEGVAEQLAPFVDVDGDGIYNPINGDYPYIQGEKAIYVILNDEGGPHMVSGGSSMGLEVHAMFYQVAESGALNNTTFMNVKIFNRRDLDFEYFRFGVFTDFDLGFYGDDYVGTDSLRNMMYVYNSVATDPGGFGQPGYGTDVPAAGMIFLSQDMYSGMTGLNGAGPTGDPTDDDGFNNYLSARWADGVPLTEGGAGYLSGGPETNYAFHGNPTIEGWTEIDEGLAGADRRAIMSADVGNFASGNEVCLDVAFTAADNAGDYIGNITSLKEAADAIQIYYNENIQPCSNIHVRVPEQPSISMDIYPNPTAGEIQIKAEGNYHLNLLSMEGKLVQSLGEHHGLTSVHLPVESGIYLLELSTDKARVVRKVQVVR